MTLQPPAWVADAVFYQIFPDPFAASERVVMETGLASPYRDWFNLNVAQLASVRPLRAYPDESSATSLDVGEVPDWARFGPASLARYGYEAWWDLPPLPKLKTRDASFDRVVTDGGLDVRLPARDGLVLEAGPA